MKKVLALILALMCIATAAFAAEMPEMPPIPVVGGEAPDFEVTLLDGTQFKLSEQRGKVVFLNIWATWCGPCVAEMPEIQQLSEDYAEEVVFIGVNCGEDEQTIVDFVEANGYTYLFAADPMYEISMNLYPTTGIPYTIVIDPDGIITELHVGGGRGVYEIFEGYILEAIANAEARKPVEILA